MPRPTKESAETRLARQAARERHGVDWSSGSPFSGPETCLCGEPLGACECGTPICCADAKCPECGRRTR